MELSRLKSVRGLRPLATGLLAMTLLAYLVLIPEFGRAQQEQFSDAPEFPPGLPWLNVSKPLDLPKLRGKIVVLDFWTYGCINCLHVADELRELEEKYGNALAVIGVHSPKFDNERDLDTLKHNIKRYGLRHPVVQDEDFHLMEAYGARAWPTLSVIDPRGKYVARIVGEDVKDRLGRIIDYLLARDRDVIDESPLPLAILEHQSNAAGLAGPGKVAIGYGIVAVSDTLNHRVLISTPEGQVTALFGGTPGFQDGDASSARFRSPQGLAIGRGKLFVADAGNHAVRVIDLEDGQVDTLAGTGRVGYRLRDTLEGTGLAMDLRSPWALALDGKDLYVAMAGSHQIWMLDLESGNFARFAGSGREGIDDGPLHEATFSQPSGLALVGRRLYVVDPEASAVREINLDKRRVKTLVGTGLFDFGDRDGDFKQAQFQHPGGIAALDSTRLLIADSYNHKLRLIHLAERRVDSVKNAVTMGSENDALPLNEPGGIAASGDLVLIADTNNDRLLSYDLEKREWKPWPLDWPQAYRPGLEAAPSSQ